MAKLNLESVLSNQLVVVNVTAGLERVGSGLAAKATDPVLLPLQQLPADEQPPVRMYDPTTKVGFTSSRTGRSVRAGSTVTPAGSPRRTDEAARHATHAADALNRRWRPSRRDGSRGPSDLAMICQAVGHARGLAVG